MYRRQGQPQAGAHQPQTAQRRSGGDHHLKQTETQRRLAQYRRDRQGKTKIKDALKEEKRKIADEGKYIVQRKLENFGAAYNQHNIDVLTTFYKLSSSLDFFYQVSVRNIDSERIEGIPPAG
jgi:hypothetical protein